MKPSEPSDILQGIPASPGLAVGWICFWNDPEVFPRYQINPEVIPEELQRLDEALATSQQQLDLLRQRVERELGQAEAAIFSAHNLLLNDPAFYAEVEKKLRQQHLNLEAAVADVVEEMARMFFKIPDPYMSERADDYRDVGRRLLNNLLSYQRQCALAEGELIILVARELMPSDTVHFQRQHIGAFVTERGGTSSHAAILARSLRLPAVVGVPDLMHRLRAGDRVVVEGNTGQVVLQPNPDLVQRAQADTLARARAATAPKTVNPIITRDKVAIVLAANLTRESEAEEAQRQGALGVGLLRTEFLFMDQGEFLDEEKQYQAYCHLLDVMRPHPITIRTLDLGEDKLLDFKHPLESPAGHILGWRSLRLSLAHQDVFLEQLRAILRAAAYGPVKMLLPMVSGLEDLLQVRSLIQTAAEELGREGKPCRADLPVGAMIETPAAAIYPEAILSAADFLSVGTNDLVQYVMVADRVSTRMQPYYRSTAPAILRLLQGLVEASQRAGKEISICGEMAGDPVYAPLLVGLGFRRLSVAPVLLPDLARVISRLTFSDCQALVKRCWQMNTAEEILLTLQAYFSALP